MTAHPRAWLLALLILVGCTDDPAVVPTSTAASPGRTLPGTVAAPPAQPVATPPRTGTASGATPAPVAVGAPQQALSPVELPPPQATPDPNRPTPTPLPTPTPTPLPGTSTTPDGGATTPAGGNKELSFAELATIDVPSDLLFHPSAVRLRSAAAANAFFIRALGAAPLEATTVNWTSQELLALYAPGSEDPAAGCVPPRLGKLIDQGSSIAYTLSLPSFLTGCDETAYEPSYQLVAIARTDKPITGFTEFTQ